jgi:hypothetical protein
MEMVLLKTKIILEIVQEKLFQRLLLELHKQKAI